VSQARRHKRHYMCHRHQLNTCNTDCAGFCRTTTAQNQHCRLEDVHANESVPSPSFSSYTSDGNCRQMHPFTELSEDRDVLSSRTHPVQSEKRINAIIRECGRVSTMTKQNDQIKIIQEERSSYFISDNRKDIHTIP